MKRSSAFALGLLMCLAIAGCRTMPVYNVPSKPVVTSSGKQVSADQVRAAIVEAAHDKGWVVTKEDPGQILAEVQVRDHRAEVEIDYSATQYSIAYNNSENLLYNGTSIHRNYNKWVELLERQIDQRLNEL